MVSLGSLPGLGFRVLGFRVYVTCLTLSGGHTAVEELEGSSRSPLPMVLAWVFRGFPKRESILILGNYG